MVCLLRLSVMSPKDRRSLIDSERRNITDPTDGQRKDSAPSSRNTRLPASFQPVSDSAIPLHKILKG